MRNLGFSIGEYYHIYNRGVDKRIVFNEKRDYLRFIFLLYICNNTEPIHTYQKKPKQYSELFNYVKSDTLVDIGAYCLMPNHFHILVKEKCDGGTSKFMQKLSTAYTMYFNSKYLRTGSLFQNTFKAQHSSNDRYLKYLFSYIHLNPVKIIEPHWKNSGIKNYSRTRHFLQSYQFSSYLDYQNLIRAESKILNKFSFPDYLKNAHDFESSICDFLDLSTEV